MAADDKFGHAIDHARAEREYLRWVLLLALWHARPYGTNESVLLGACRDIPVRATNDDVRRELVSLAKRNLVTIKRRAQWIAELTADGEAVVDYRAEAPIDVARPRRG
jgi:hypothetical protein